MIRPPSTTTGTILHMHVVGSPARPPEMVFSTSGSSRCRFCTQAGQPSVIYRTQA